MGPRSSSNECDYVQCKCIDIFPNPKRVCKNVSETFSVSKFKHFDKVLLLDASVV